MACPKALCSSLCSAITKANPFSSTEKLVLGVLGGGAVAATADIAAQSYQHWQQKTKQTEQRRVAFRQANPNVSPYAVDSIKELQAPSFWSSFISDELKFDQKRTLAAASFGLLLFRPFAHAPITRAISSKYAEITGKAAIKPNGAAIVIEQLLLTPLITAGFFATNSSSTGRSFCDNFSALKRELAPTLALQYGAWAIATPFLVASPSYFAVASALAGVEIFALSVIANSGSAQLPYFGPKLATMFPSSVKPAAVEQQQQQQQQY